MKVQKVDIEIPLGRRTLKYRFFEILPAVLSFGAIILMFVLSIFSPFLASVYLLTIITTLLVKAIGIAYRMITGHIQIEKAQKVDWNKRLKDLENAKKMLKKYGSKLKKSIILSNTFKIFTIFQTIMLNFQSLRKLKMR